MPISRPMMPPPMMSIFFGTWRNSSAPVESTMRGSSGIKGNLTTREPAAMVALAKRTIFCVPSPAVTCRWLASRNAPTPCTTLTLRIFAMPAKPVVSFFTTLSL